MKKYILGVFTLALLFVHTVGFSQLQKTQAAFIFNFALFIRWPEGYQTGVFEIAVFGSSDVVKELEMMTFEKEVWGQPVKIKQITSLATMGNPHIIFVPNDQQAKLKQILKATDQLSTLVVTETPGLGQKGATINFVMVSNKLKFELNSTLAEKKGMILPDKLVKLGIPVNTLASN